MQRETQLLFRSGCLVSVLLPIVGAVLYPRAKWLFAFALVGIALLAIAALTSKKPTPHEMAELAERIVNGTCGRWDVDDYEHWSPKDPEARALWNRTMTVGGPPEEWVGLDEAQKNELRSTIRTLRQLGNPRL